MGTVMLSKRIACLLAELKEKLNNELCVSIQHFAI